MATTKDQQITMTPESAIKRLKDGNSRFIQSNGVSRDLSNEVKQTSTGQNPYATVLHCID